MSTKTCSKCKETYPPTAKWFSRNKNSHDGLFGRCKVCKRESDRKSHLKHRTERLEKRKAFRQSHKKEKAEQDRAYREKVKKVELSELLSKKKKVCKKCGKTKLIKSFYKNTFQKDGLTVFCNKCHDQYKLAIEIRVKQYKREWQQDNKIRLSQYQKGYRKTHLKERGEYNSTRKETDINFKLLCNLRSRLWSILKIQKTNKSASTIKLTGCTIEELKNYIQSKFLNGMAWDNYGSGKDKWSIDHLIPCASFDLSNPEEQKKCFHLW